MSFEIFNSDALMDAKSMTFPNESFECVLDKATLDSMLVIFKLMNSVERLPLKMLMQWCQKYIEFLRVEESILSFHMVSQTTE